MMINLRRRLAWLVYPEALADVKGLSDQLEEAKRYSDGLQARIEERDGAHRRDPEFLEICNMVNNCPITQSLLYDLNLLPEQTMTDPVRWKHTKEACRHIALAKAQRIMQAATRASGVDPSVPPLVLRLEHDGGGGADNEAPAYYTPERLATWLDAKYARHKEYEDKAAANLIRQFARLWKDSREEESREARAAAGNIKALKAIRTIARGDYDLRDYGPAMREIDKLATAALDERAMGQA